MFLLVVWEPLEADDLGLNGGRRCAVVISMPMVRIMFG